MVISTLVIVHFVEQINDCVIVFYDNITWGNVTVIAMCCAIPSKHWTMSASICCGLRGFLSYTIIFTYPIHKV